MLLFDCEARLLPTASELSGGGTRAGAAGNPAAGTRAGAFARSRC
jgi:hypothetical protein